MKVIYKQHNSKLCFVCGMDNKFGLRAPFYSMEDGSVVSIFTYDELHQSYPGRVHGGLITAMLDELGLRALWALEGSEEQFGVTMSLETKYHKPVPYGEKLIARGVITQNRAMFCTAETTIMDEQGTLLAAATMKYLKLDAKKIADEINTHEEMSYLIADEVYDIDFAE